MNETVLPRMAWAALALAHGLPWQYILALGTRWKQTLGVRDA